VITQRERTHAPVVLTAAAGVPVGEPAVPRSTVPVTVETATLPTAPEPGAPARPARGKCRPAAPELVTALVVTAASDHRVGDGEAELAAQVPKLTIADRCRCGDDFCSSFYTQPKPKGPYGPGHRCLDLDAPEGMLLIDVVEGKIAHVEVLNRDDVRRKLRVAVP